MSLRATYYGIASALLTAALLVGCGGAGCDDGHNHRHPVGTTWERGERWDVACRCTEDGVVCDDDEPTATAGGIDQG